MATKKNKTTTALPEDKHTAHEVCANCVYCYDADHKNGTGRCSKFNTDINLSDPSCAKGEARQ